LPPARNFGFANYATASFWIRLKTAGTPGNTIAVKNIVKLYKGGVAQSADVILGVADGWVHITTQLTSTVGYNNAFPHISARSGDVVQIAVPAFFAGEANPGVHKAPLPTAFSTLTHNLFSDRHPDVDASDVPANGEVLSYDSAAGKWKASGFGRNRVTLASDVVNNNAVANTFQDVTGLSFSVVAGTLYKFVAMIAFDAAATTTGSRWSVSGPASPTRLFYIAEWTLTATSSFRSIQSAYDAGAVQATSILSGNLCRIEGIIQPSANGTFVIRFASEVAGSAITAKAGSTLEWW
jgi:hypothetical protein